MKSLEELLSYYFGVHKGSFATTEQQIGSGSGRVELGKNRKDIDSALIYESDRLAKASLASFLASSQLRSGGHRTWGEISIYYCRFQINSAMLTLVGVAPNGNRLLLRTEEVNRQYINVPRKDPDAKRVGFIGGGSHRENWRMFSRYFRDWTDKEPPSTTASVLTEDPKAEAWDIQGYEFAVIMRNESNYLKDNAGLFFPETDFTGGQEWTVSTAKVIGNWDWLRTDTNPLSEEEPPEAYFFSEMMAWDLIKYVIKALVSLEGQYLLDQDIWILENLDAHDELREHMMAELRTIPVT